MVDFTANATNITAAVQYLNTTHDGLFGVGFVLVVFVVIFGALIRWGQAQAAAVAGTITMLCVFFLTILGVVSTNMAAILLLLYVFLVFFVYIGARFGN